MSIASYGSKWIEYLKDPLLVAKFQRKCGIGFNPLDTLHKVDEGGVQFQSEYCEYKQNELEPPSERESNGVYRRQRVGDNFESANLDSGEQPAKNLKTERLKCDAEDEKNLLNRTPSPKDDDPDLFKKVVGNKFLYYLFQFGTALGDEVFYASFFSFWFWNVDGAVGRRVVLVWALVMYIGQGLKDIICWPRPASPPVIRLEKKWELEYGMPSTHAMTGAAVPFSILIFTSCRYEYPFLLGVFFSLLWCALVCSSRIYLGMHSVLDVVAGLTLVAGLFVWVIPFVDWLDPIILTDEFGALYILSGAILLALCSPGGDRWTPARGDTVVILGSAVGLITGAWMNYQLGIISSNGPAIDMPFPVMWPSYKMLWLSLLRLILGLCIVLITRQIAKSTTKTFFAGLVQSKNISCISNPTSREIFVELSNKFVTYLIVGFNIVFLAPTVFRLIGIERPTFHTEV